MLVIFGWEPLAWFFLALAIFVLLWECILPEGMALVLGDAISAVPKALVGWLVGLFVYFFLWMVGLASCLLAFGCLVVCWLACWFVWLVIGLIKFGILCWGYVLIVSCSFLLVSKYTIPKHGSTCHVFNSNTVFLHCWADHPVFFTVDPSISSMG